MIIILVVHVKEGLGVLRESRSVIYGLKTSFVEYERDGE